MAACATTTATTSTGPATTTSAQALTTTTVAPVTTASAAPATSATTPALLTTEVMVGDDSLDVWVADDREERQQGLRGVTGLPNGVDGMLFVFPRPATPNFVMSDTLIPLEVWFFDEEGVLIGSHEMTPCAAEPCPLYPAPGPVGWGLETPLGEHDFQGGDLLSTSASG